MNDRHLEIGFFAASADEAATRADAFADLDPTRSGARSERRVFAGVIVLACLVVGILASLAPDLAEPGRMEASATAAPLPIVEGAMARSEIAPTVATTQGPAAPSPRLAALLEAAPAAPETAPEIAAAPETATAASVDSARAALEGGRYADAIATLAEQPSSFDVQALRGWALYELGRDVEALGALRAALEVRPDHPESLLLLGSLQQGRDPQAAAQTYRAFLRAHPEAPQAAEVQRILERI